LQLTRKNIVEIVSFIIVNLLLTIYGFFQVYQFRGFGSFCLPITFVGFLALVNVSLVSLVEYMRLYKFLLAGCLSSDLHSFFYDCLTLYLCWIWLANICPSEW